MVTYVWIMIDLCLVWRWWFIKYSHWCWRWKEQKRSPQFLSAICIMDDDLFVFCLQMQFLVKGIFPHTHTRAHTKCRQKDMYRFLPICHLSTDCYLLIFFSFSPLRKKSLLNSIQDLFENKKYKNKQTNKQKWTRTSV